MASGKRQPRRKAGKVLYNRLTPQAQKDLADLELALEQIRNRRRDGGADGVENVQDGPDSS